MEWSTSAKDVEVGAQRNPYQDAAAAKRGHLGVGSSVATPVGVESCLVKGASCLGVEGGREALYWRSVKESGGEGIHPTASWALVSETEC